MGLFEGDLVGEEGERVGVGGVGWGCWGLLRDAGGWWVVLRGLLS